MDKSTFSKLRYGITGALVAAASVFSAPASAEMLFTESFNYTAGDLYPQGKWLQSAHKTSPVQVKDIKLSYDGFASGKSVELKPGEDLTAQDVFHACVSRDDETAEVSPISSGDIYVGFLINAQSVTTKQYFFSLITTNYSYTLNDGKAPSIGGYVVAFPSENEGKFKLGFHKSSTNPAAAYQTADLDLNKTYLVVLHYEINSGTTNDIFEAWINPTKEKTKATVVSDISKADLSKGFVGVGLHQAGSDNNYDMLVGPIRVATTWDELFGGDQGGGDDPAPTASITASAPQFPQNFFLYQYQKYTSTMTVKATGITEDITVSGFSTGLTPSVTTIPAAEATSEQGYQLSLSLDASAGQGIEQTLVFTSGDTQATLPVNVAVQPANTMMNFRSAPSAKAYEYYLFSSNARVTYVDAPNQKMYLEDIVGGVVVDYASMTGLEKAPFKAGDKISNIYLLAAEPSQNVPQFYLCGYFGSDNITYGKRLAENDFKTPTQVTLAEIVESPEYYINRLVQVDGLTFTYAGETLTTAGTVVTSGTATGRVRPFAGTSAVGVTIPSTASVTGISTSMAAGIITVRAAEDITASQEKSGIEFETTLLVDPAEYYPINVATPFATLKIKATNMPNATALWVGGKQRNAFTIDMDEIPAGTGEYTLNITFKPTTTGTNSAVLNFDANPTELSKTTSMTCKAYDPDNLPEFTVDASGVTDFAAAPGSTQEQTLTITAANLLDYGSVRVLGQGNGAFRIGSTSFLKSGQTTLKVTFAPTTAGTYQETIEFSTPMATTQTVVVKGECSGTAPGEDKQGDELTFDTTSPYAQYATDFTGSGDNNKPLSLAGWKNVAVDGTRAFWSYTTDGNTMAKVTAYDSKMDASAEAPAEMLLMSPALNFKDSPSRLLSFRVKGDNLTDDMTDQLSVIYIDPAQPETERYYVIDGIDIPASADATGEWREFIVDLNALPIPDTFFIGFHFLSTRGRNTSTIYYIDDFSWGDDTTPFIRVDKNVAVAPITHVGEVSPIEEITVTGLCLSEPIAIDFEGADKTHFALAQTELPAEGGKLSVSYSPQEKGEHTVYVTLKSAGAPATYITVGGTCDGNSGISDIAAENDTETMYFNLQGVRVIQPTAGKVYIRVNGGKVTKIMK